jgi:hypothetical protein
MSQLKTKIYYEARLNKGFKDKYGKTHEAGTVIDTFTQREFEKVMLPKKSMGDYYYPQIVHGHGDSTYFNFNKIFFVKVTVRIIATEDIVKPQNIKKGE